MPIPAFAELDYQPTPLGALSLRRRVDPGSGETVFEVKLGEAFLMSSRFVASEVALARLGLAACGDHALDVVVGGLGLGHTAAAVLDEPRVRELVVVELFAPVIDWHRRHLVPLGQRLASDPRCHLVQGDFFALAAGEAGFDPDTPGRRFDAVLVDIDHSPDFLLDPAAAGFYTPEGLARLARHLVPGGVFGLWSNDPPAPAFIDRLAEAFASGWAEPVTFMNPLQGREVTQTVYLAQTVCGQMAA
jgi:spermidine synthase